MKNELYKNKEIIKTIIACGKIGTCRLSTWKLIWGQYMSREIKVYSLIQILHQEFYPQNIKEKKM